MGRDEFVSLVVDEDVLETLSCEIPGPKHHGRLFGVVFEKQVEHRDERCKGEYVENGGKQVECEGTEHESFVGSHIVSHDKEKGFHLVIVSMD